MLSRRGNRPTKPLRKAHSSDSSLRHEHFRGSTGSETGGSHHHALTAAELAFMREYGIRKPVQQVVTPDRPNEPRPALQRTQSVRFAGPKAVPLRNSSITRRQATSWDRVEVRSTYSALGRRQSVRSIDRALTTLPQPNSIVSTPSSKAGSLKRTRSMLNRRGSRSSHRVSENTPLQVAERSYRSEQDDASVRSPGDARTTKHDIMLARALLEERFGADLRSMREDSPGSINRGELKKRLSTPHFGRRGRSPKPFRKSVRSNSTVYGATIASSPVHNAPAPRVSTIGLRVRHMSSSVKSRVKQAFRRSSGSSDSIPDQQVDACKTHFGDAVQNPPEENRYPFVPMPDEELVSYCSSRASSPRGSPVPVNPMPKQGSVRTVQSVASDVSKSRVTSWANSTVADGTQRVQPVELKRLSIIQEDGDAHQPSSSAGYVGHGSRGRRVHELFRRPLRPGTGRMNEPVHSSAIYSALQRRLEEIKLGRQERTRPRAAGSEPGRHTSAETSTQAITSTPATRNVSGESDGSCHTTIRLVDASPTPDAVSAVLLEHARSRDQDDVFEPPSISRSPVDSAEAATIAAEMSRSEESNAHEQGNRGTRGKTKFESGFTFFPTHRDAQEKDLSPYRKAVLARIVDEGNCATVYNPALIAPNTLSSRLEAISERNDSDQSVSESHYSHGIGSPSAGGFRGQPYSHNSDSDTDMSKSDLAGWRIRDPHLPTLTHPSAEHGSPSSDGYPDHRAWARTSGTVDASQWRKNGWVQQSAMDSKHIREHAQFCEDETDSHAQAHATEPVLQSRLANRQSVLSLRHKERSGWPDWTSSRLPLQERDASQVQNVRDDVPSNADIWAHTTPNTENKRLSSSYQLHPPRTPQSLSQKASIASLASQVRAAFEPTDGCGGSSPRGPARPASMLSSRHSPERIARLRRLQSNQTLRPRTVPEAATVEDEPTQAVQDYFAETRLAGHSLAENTLARGEPEGRSTPGGGKLVEDFLDKRRGTREVSGRSVGPVFL